VTVAVCLHCGAYKVGAFTLCPACGYEPHDDESLTKHLMVTDHYLSAEQLDDISQRVKAGVVLTFDPASMKEMWVSKSELDHADKTFRLIAYTLLTLFLALAAYGWLHSSSH
jgi:hypothetical protein